MELAKSRLGNDFDILGCFFCAIYESSDVHRFSGSAPAFGEVYTGVILQAPLARLDPASPSTCTDPEGAILDPESSCSSVDLPAPEWLTYDLQGWISYVLNSPSIDFTQLKPRSDYDDNGFLSTCECCCLAIKTFMNLPILPEYPYPKW